MSSWQLFELVLFLLFSGILIYGYNRLLAPSGQRLGSFWRGSKGFRLAVAFTLLNLDLLLLPPTREWWVGVYWAYWPYLLTFYGVSVVGFSLMKENPKTEGRVGFTVATLTCFCILYFLGAFDLQYTWKSWLPKADIRLEKHSTAVVQTASTDKTGPGYTEILPVSEENCQMIAQVASRRIDSTQAINLAEIARSESGCNHFRPDGSLYEHIARNGGHGSGARGYFMFLHSHDARAESMGLDLNKPEDSIDYAVRLAMENIAAGRPIDDPYWLASRGGRGVPMYASTSTPAPQLQPITNRKRAAKEIEVVAPIGGWSCIYEVGRGSYFYTLGGQILRRDQDGRVWGDPLSAISKSDIPSNVDTACFQTYRPMDDGSPVTIYLTKY